MKTLDEYLRERYSDEEIAEMRAKAKREFPDFLRKAQREAPAVEAENERRRLQGEKE